MFEIFVAALSCFVMAKIASMDGQSPAAWGLITALLCGASLFIPLPFLRIGIAAVASFVAMFVFKIIANR